MTVKYTVFVLLYGDYTHLARRVLDSLLMSDPKNFKGDYIPIEIRVGLNEVSPSTKQYVDQLITSGKLQNKNVYTSEKNIHKYPIMRYMFFDENNPITSPWTMWFDDDSFVKDTKEFFFTLEKTINRLEKTAAPPAMYGQTWFMNLGGNQHYWVKDQPWYRGKEVEPTRKVRFCTGGWWCTKTDVIQQLNWPVPEIDHRGGDVMLGEALRQLDLPLKHYHSHVAINADQSGNDCKSPRRGFDSKPVGWNYEPGGTRVVKDATEGAPLEIRDIGL
jgi:hypothetical protein